MAQISRWVWSDCATLVVGCTLYSNYERTAVYANKQVTITSGGIKRVYSTMVSGAIVSISDCTWTSSSAYNIYNPPYTGVKNDCGNGGSGSSITVNDGGAYSFAGTTTPVVSYISQADADSQAQTAAQNNFYAGIQNYINNNGTCTWTYYSGSGTYPATNYTRNNCGSGCEAGTVLYQAVTKTGYAATSTISYQNAIDTANASAYSAAEAESKSLGQANANTYGTCCCWVSAADCSGCNYRGNRQRNTCTNEYRNETPTAYNTCDCGIVCQGTNYDYSECLSIFGTGPKDRRNSERYNCYPYSFTGNSYDTQCGCDNGAQSISSTGYTTCVGCQNVTIFKDYNRCSGTGGHYFVNGSDVGTSMPSTSSCNTTPDYGDDQGIKCVDGTNYYVYGNYNSCGNYRYKYVSGNETNYTNNGAIFSTACTFSAYRSGTFTRNNCPSGYTAGSVSYSNTYYYNGINNQSGAESLADANFNNDGQNYANANASCTPPPTCYTYNIISNDDNVYVDGLYTTCAGYTDYFSFYSSSSYTLVGSVCAQASSVYVSQNGFPSSSGGC